MNPLLFHLNRHYLILLNRVRRLYFKYIDPQPYPNFNNEEVVMEYVHFDTPNPDGSVDSQPESVCLFRNYNPLLCQNRGWFRNFYEYRLVAGLIFAKRFPEHPYAKQLRGKKSPFKYTDEIIDGLGSGEYRVIMTFGDETTRTEICDSQTYTERIRAL